jgi:adenylylsulfate kinase-like enzyme
MTGMSSPYEEPLCPDFTVNGTSEDPDRIADDPVSDTVLVVPLLGCARR